MRSPDAVVFDVGRVLVDFNHQSLLDFLEQHGAEVRTPREFVERTDLFRYECGQLSTAEYLTNLNGLLPVPVDAERVMREWLCLFQPIDEMIELARRLRTGHSVYLLSNTNALHWGHLNEAFRLNDLAEDALTSFEAGFMKPDSRIYQTAEQRFGLEPARTVFIDDVQDNAAAARDRGWHAIHHRNPAATRDALNALGIEAD